MKLGRTCVLGAASIWLGFASSVGHSKSGANNVPCFDPPYPTRQAANERLGECFPAGTDAAAFVSEMNNIADQGAQKKRVFDAIENQEFDGYGYEMAVQQPDGYTDTWRIWALAEIGTGEIFVAETAVIYEPEDFAGRGIPFDFLSFQTRDIATALRSYFGEDDSRQRLDELMQRIGAKFVGANERNGELSVQYRFEDRSITMSVRLFLAELRWLMTFKFSTDGHLKSIFVSS